MSLRFWWLKAPPSCPNWWQRSAIRRGNAGMTWRHGHVLLGFWSGAGHLFQLWEFEKMTIYTTQCQKIRRSSNPTPFSSKLVRSRSQPSVHRGAGQDTTSPDPFGDIMLKVRGACLRSERGFCSKLGVWKGLNSIKNKCRTSQWFLKLDFIQLLSETSSYRKYNGNYIRLKIQLKTYSLSL